MHYGIDIDGSDGDEVYASRTGKIVISNKKTFHVVMSHQLPSGQTIYTHYYHVNPIIGVSKNEIKQGTKIATVASKDDTGFSPHLHFSISYIAQTYENSPYKINPSPLNNCTIDNSSWDNWMLHWGWIGSRYAIDVGLTYIFK